jgi:hypothetical protein
MYLVLASILYSKGAKEGFGFIMLEKLTLRLIHRHPSEDFVSRLSKPTFRVQYL